MLRSRARAFADSLGPGRCGDRLEAPPGWLLRALSSPRDAARRTSHAPTARPSFVTADIRPARGALDRLGLPALPFPPFRIFFLANLSSNASWFIFSASLNTYILQLTGSAADVG